VIWEISVAMRMKRCADKLRHKEVLMGKDEHNMMVSIDHFSRKDWMSKMAI
jgi:hypothetical protein